MIGWYQILPMVNLYKGHAISRISRLKPLRVLYRIAWMLAVNHDNGILSKFPWFENCFDSFCMDAPDTALLSIELVLFRSYD